MTTNMRGSNSVLQRLILCSAAVIRRSGRLLVKGGCRHQSAGASPSSIGAVLKDLQRGIVGGHVHPADCAFLRCCRQFLSCIGPRDAFEMPVARSSINYGCHRIGAVHRVGNVKRLLEPSDAPNETGKSFSVICCPKQSMQSHNHHYRAVFRAGIKRDWMQAAPFFSSSLGLRFNLLLHVGSVALESTTSQSEKAVGEADVAGVGQGSGA